MRNRTKMSLYSQGLCKQEIRSDWPQLSKWNQHNPSKFQNIRYCVRCNFILSWTSSISLIRLFLVLDETNVIRKRDRLNFTFTISYCQWTKTVEIFLPTTTSSQNTHFFLPLGFVEYNISSYVESNQISFVLSLMNFTKVSLYVSSQYPSSTHIV